MAAFHSKQTDDQRKMTNSRKHTPHRKMYNNLLTHVFDRMKQKRSSSRVIKATKVKYKRTKLVTEMYAIRGERRSTSRDKTVSGYRGTMY